MQTRKRNKNQCLIRKDKVNNKSLVNLIKQGKISVSKAPDHPLLS